MKEQTPQFNLSELPREALERLCIHLLKADRLREETNINLIEHLNNEKGDAHQHFEDWCADNKELSDASDREISSIIAGAAPGALQN